MVRLNVIYTRTGDRGESGLGDGSRRSKSDARFVAMGDVDETDSRRRPRPARHPRLGRAGARPDRRDARAHPKRPLRSRGRPLPAEARRRKAGRGATDRGLAGRGAGSRHRCAQQPARRCARSYCRAGRRRRRRCIWRAPSAGAPSAASSRWPQSRAKRSARPRSPISTACRITCSSPPAPPTITARKTCSGFPAKARAKADERADPFSLWEKGARSAG